jgi:hypothetical protein
MADKKVSELTVATSVGAADVLPLVQSSVTKKVTADALFNSVPGNLKYVGFLAQSATPQVVTSGAINVTANISHLANSTGADAALTLAAGTSGMEKTLVATSLLTNAAIVTLTGEGFTTLTFNTTGDTAKLLYTNSKWFVLSLNGATRG